MKDYSYSFLNPCKNEENVEPYYLFYEKENGKIHAYLSNGSVKEFSDSIDIERMLIERMEAQVIKFGDESIMLNYNKAENVMIKALHFTLFSGCSSFVIPNDLVYLTLFNYTVLGASLLAGYYGDVNFIQAVSIKRDYEKHKLFLDNKELIQTGSYKDLRPLAGINKKALKEARSNIDSDQESININTIRLLKESEINNIIERIKDKNKIYSFTKE